MSSYRVGFVQQDKDTAMFIIDEDYCIHVLQNRNREAKLMNGMLTFPDKWHVVDSHINSDGSLAVNIIFDGDEEC